MAQVDKYVLKYFNVRVLGETSRLLFKLANVDFVDERYPRIPYEKEPSWELVKDSGQFPFNKLPILIVDGKHTIGQSAAIERYIAKQLGFFGKDDLEAARIDSVLEQLGDIQSAFNVYRIASGEEKTQLKTKFYAEQLPEFARLYERWLKAEGTGHFVGHSFSVADVKVYFRFSSYDDQDAVSAALKSAPLLHALIQKVANHPHIAKWVKERPVTFA